MEEKNNSIKKTARFAGFLYLLLAVFGAFGILYIPSLIVPGDTATTVSNIMASELLFRSAIVSGLIAQIIFIFLVLTLYKLLKSVNKNAALLMVAFVMVSVPIAILNMINWSAALLLLSANNYLTVFPVDQLYAQVMVFLDLHEYGINIVQIFWGLWLLPLGYLVFKSGFIPRILGVLLIIGGFGYLIDFATFFLFPNLDVSVAQFMFIGELLFLFWLLFKGVKIQQTN